jgi:putative FmdB family regulatory protein
MPLYEYNCKSCGTDFEKRVSFSEADTNPECPECNSPQTHKQISLFASHGASLSSAGGYSSGGCAPSSSGFS